MFRRSKKFTITAVLTTLLMIGVAFAAQTALTPITLKQNNYLVQPGDLAVTETACDNVNGNLFPFTGKEILWVHNTDVGTQTFTVTSVADSLGRTGDINAYSMATGTFAAIDLTQIAGWKQTSGNLLLACSAATVKFVVLRHA